MVVKMYIKYSITDRTFWISIAEIIVHKMFHCSYRCMLNVRLQKKMNIQCLFDEEEFEDTKEVIRILISNKLYTLLHTCGYIYYYTIWDKWYRKNLNWKKTVMLEMSWKCLVFSDSIRYTYYLVLSWLRVPLVKQELLTLPEHLSSPPVFSVVRVAGSLVFCVVFCRLLFVLLSFLFGYCVVCPSISSFWLPFLQIYLSA